ncbi:MAG: DNA topoisomerase VI subunit [Planctomycetota bacterium]|nr:MAG: DNA topoisomerase VI subunit [Planctomycetota bacterium]
MIASIKKNDHVLKSIARLGEDSIDEIKRQKNPSVDIPLRNLSNVNFNPKKAIIEMGKAKQAREFFNIGMAKKYMQTFLVAEKCKDVLDEGKTVSIRDLYYMSKSTIPGTSENTFDEQDESDPIIEDLEVTADALREELGLYASNKGALVGEITIRDSGDTIDGRRMGSGGWSIPSICEPNFIQFKRCDAKFILLVEKDAVFRRLNEDKFWKSHKCILVTGGGQPPRGLRRLLYRMVNELKLPLYTYVDNDPWGYYIYSVVKQGSINLAYESVRMAVPHAKFIGLSSFDKERFKLPDNVTIKLLDEDIKRAKQLLEYPWFQKTPWQKEIRNMLKLGYKLEQEALSKRGISFVTEEYLPKKIKDKDFLD